MSGKVRKVFPGGNTSQGFFSYYDYIIEKDATRIFVIKGGPGVGKSTFMKRVEKDMLELGYDVEEHHCSSDNNSLDGLVIPSIRVALLDGTAPHVVDPKNPGVVDDTTYPKGILRYALGSGGLGTRRSIGWRAMSVLFSLSLGQA